MNQASRLKPRDNTWRNPKEYFKTEKLPPILSIHSQYFSLSLDYETREKSVNLYQASLQVRRRGCWLWRAPDCWNMNTGEPWGKGWFTRVIRQGEREDMWTLRKGVLNLGCDTYVCIMHILAANKIDIVKKYFTT